MVYIIGPRLASVLLKFSFCFLCIPKPFSKSAPIFHKDTVFTKFLDNLKTRSILDMRLTAFLVVQATLDRSDMPIFLNLDTNSTTFHFRNYPKSKFNDAVTYLASLNTFRGLGLFFASQFTDHIAESKFWNNKYQSYHPFTIFFSNQHLSATAFSTSVSWLSTERTLHISSTL